MAKYATRVEGVIKGWTRWPNDESTTPIDEQSPEWLLFLVPPTKQEVFDDRIDNDPVLKALFDELEISNLGFRERVRGRV